MGFEAMINFTGWSQSKYDIFGQDVGSTILPYFMRGNILGSSVYCVGSLSLHNNKEASLKDRL